MSQNLVCRSAHTPSVSLTGEITDGEPHVSNTWTALDCPVTISGAVQYSTLKNRQTVRHRKKRHRKKRHPTKCKPTYCHSDTTPFQYNAIATQQQSDTTQFGDIARNTYGCAQAPASRLTGPSALQGLLLSYPACALIVRPYANSSKLS